MLAEMKLGLAKLKKEKVTSQKKKRSIVNLLIEYNPQLMMVRTLSQMQHTSIEHREERY